MNKLTGPVRNVSPCKGCDRPDKKPGCHGNCEPYDKWRADVAETNRKRVEYRDAPRPAYRDPNTGKRWW